LPWSRSASIGVPAAQLDDLERPGAMVQAAQETALLQRRNQPVDARFRLQSQRILHLVEGGRNALGLHTFMDKHQKFVLFTGQHLASPFASRGTNQETEPRSSLVH
jgi:hypothetical protein